MLKLVSLSSVFSGVVATTLIRTIYKLWLYLKKGLKAGKIREIKFSTFCQKFLTWQRFATFLGVENADLGMTAYGQKQDYPQKGTKNLGNFIKNSKVEQIAEN
jgi:hypothetical protein